jgi:hypothetical protein
MMKMADELLRPTGTKQNSLSVAKRDTTQHAQTVPDWLQAIQQAMQEQAVK